MKGFKREIGCIYIPHSNHLYLFTDNNGGSVEFDWFAFKEKVGLDFEADYIIMLHTHPPGMEKPSSIDKNMVYGWNLALGKSIVYCIVNEDTIYASVFDKEFGPEYIFGFDNQDFIPSLMRLFSCNTTDLTKYDLELASELCKIGEIFLGWLSEECFSQTEFEEASKQPMESIVLEQM